MSKLDIIKRYNKGVIENMGLAEWWINLLGLLLTLVGSALLYIGSAKERPEEYSSLHVGEYEGLAKEREQRIADWNKRKLLSLWGFGLLAFGILFQIISFSMQYPN